MSENVLRAVPIFEAGTHRGKPYTTADLDAIVKNFQKFSTGDNAMLRVPGVLGHEEKQEMLENFFRRMSDHLRRSDLPAAAWASRVWREGRTLHADLEDVPPKIAQLIRTRRYRTVSAEIYDQPPEGIPGTGKMLRRIAFLGGDIPQIKTLDDIPLPESHSERFDPAVKSTVRYRHSMPLAGAVITFSEVLTMDRSALLEKLGALGIDTSKITDAIPDELLADFLRVCDSLKGQMSEEDPDKVMPLKDDMPEPKDDKEKTAYMERARKYMEHAKKYMDKYCSKMGDLEIKHTDDKEKPMGGDTVKLSELNSLVSKAVADALKGSVGGAIEQFTKFREESIKTEKKRSVDSLIERLGREGKIPPAEQETERQLLLQLDASTVHKFSEQGKTVEATSFDYRVKTLERRPSLFGERFKDPASEQTGEKATAEKFYEDHKTHFTAIGTSKEEFLKVYESADPATRKQLIRQ